MEGIAPYTQTTERTNVGEASRTYREQNNGIIFTRAPKVHCTFKNSPPSPGKGAGGWGKHPKY